jgi:hypothetical protein
MGTLDWKLGRYTLHAYFTELDDSGKPAGERYWESLPVTFTVVSPSELAAYHTELGRARRAKYRDGFEDSLVSWASQQQRERPDDILKRLEADHVGLQPETEQDEELILLIGVKTALTPGFALRQAMRETWASKDSLPRGVKVLFAGCRPLTPKDEDPDNLEREGERRRLREAIELEKMVYGDLLADELDCDDTYLDLATKVKEFLHVAATKYPHAQYVMLADDDVYVRAETLVKRFERLGPRTGYYSGQVPSIQHARKDTPNRDVNVRYSLSKQQYPLSELPPMAMGAYFFLSMDCAKFVSKNRRRLQGLNGIDDITVPLWMLTIQVHVKHQAHLGYLRADPCHDSFEAFGDLSPLALREVHRNVEQSRPFCHGFDRYLWLKPSGDAVKNGMHRRLSSFIEPLQFSVAVSNVNEAELLQVTALISTPTHAGLKVSYFPSNETLRDFRRRACAETRLRFPSAVNASSCSEIADQLEGGLAHVREQMLTSS